VDLKLSRTRRELLLRNPALSIGTTQASPKTLEDPLPPMQTPRPQTSRAAPRTVQPLLPQMPETARLGLKDAPLPPVTLDMPKPATTVMTSRLAASCISKGKAQSCREYHDWVPIMAEHLKRTAGSSCPPPAFGVRTSRDSDLNCFRHRMNAYITPQIF